MNRDGDKTESCLWCGESEAQGAKLKPYHCTRHAKFVCIDTAACDERIRLRILLGPPSGAK